MLTVLDLPISITLRFAGTGGSRRGIVSGKLLRVLDDATVELKVSGCGDETVKAEWSSVHGAYIWAGREVWASLIPSHPLNNRTVPRIAAKAKDSIEDFLAWCAEQGIMLGHTVVEPSHRGQVQKFYRLNELTTGTEGMLIERYRATRAVD